MQAFIKIGGGVKGVRTCMALWKKGCLGIKEEWVICLCGKGVWI
jgi:hypothetical protein